ncbi:MAG: ECF-type sigma factor [Pseudomonadota bacterium]
MESTYDTPMPLLALMNSGEERSAAERCGEIYEELRKLAHAQRRQWVGNETLNTTAIVHEAYLKLAKRRSPFENRLHFFATAARAMRHILVSYARQATCEKRGGKTEHAAVDVELLADSVTLNDILALDDGLTRLAEIEARCARVVECHVFAGLTLAETANALSISRTTAKRDWAFATAWLYREFTGRSERVGP